VHVSTEGDCLLIHLRDRSTLPACRTRKGADCVLIMAFFTPRVADEIAPCPLADVFYLIIQARLSGGAPRLSEDFGSIDCGF
jgi:hypothetical protein